MHFTKYALALTVAVLFWQPPGRAQQMSYDQTEKTIEKIKEFSDSFEDHFDRSISRSAVDSIRLNDMKQAVERLEHAADQLEDHFDKDDAAVPWARAVLREAAVVDSMMARNPMPTGIESRWLQLRQELDLLAGSYGLSTEWPSRLARAEAAPPAVVVVPAPSAASFQIPDLLNQLQTDAIAFQASVRNSPAADAIQPRLGDFMVSLDRLNRSYSRGSLGAGDVNELLSRAETVDFYMRDYPVSVAAQEAWLRLKDDLVRLGAQFNLSPAWFAR